VAIKDIFNMDIDLDKYLNLFEESKLIKALIKLDPIRYNHLSYRLVEIKAQVNTFYGTYESKTFHLYDPNLVDKITSYAKSETDKIKKQQYVK